MFKKAMPSRKRRTPRAKASRWEGHRGADKELSCLLAEKINDIPFRLVDVVCNGGDWLATIAAVKSGRVKTTEIGERIAQNLVRVAATRIFADPSQSILEIPVNSIDAMLPERQSVGKFGMGFFSILHWIVGHPKRELRLTSAFNLRGAYMCPYQLIIKDVKGELTATVHVADVATWWKRGTKVEIHAKGDDKWTTDEIAAFKRQLDRLAYVQGVTLWGSIKGGRKGQINTYHNTKGPAIHIGISPSLVEIDDIGPGIRLEDVFGALLTPSLSTKGIQNTSALVGSKEKTESSLKSAEFDRVDRPSIAVVVNGIQVYHSPGREEVVVIEMPSWTPLPVARDDIVIDKKVVRSRFIKEVNDVIDEALLLDSKPFSCDECKFVTTRKKTMEKHKRENPREDKGGYSSDRLVYHTVKKGLRRYVRETNQTSIRSALQQVFFDVDERNKGRFVNLENFEAVYEDLVDVPGAFIAADTSDAMAIEKTLKSLLPKLSVHKVFPGRLVVKCDLWEQKVTTGGTYSYIFVDKTHYSGANWATQVRESMSLGVNLHGKGDAELKQFGDMMAALEEDGEHTAFLYEDDDPNVVDRAWKKNKTNNYKRLRVIYDRLLFMKRSCAIKNRPWRFSDAVFPESKYSKPEHKDRVKMHIMDIMATYGLFGQDHWARMVDFHIADLTSHVRGREYSASLPEIVLSGVMINEEHIRFKVPRPSKEDLEFETKLAREEQRTATTYNKTYYRIMYGSMLTAMILDAHRPKKRDSDDRLPQLAFYIEVHRFLRRADVGSIRAKMALLIEVSVLLKKVYSPYNMKSRSKSMPTIKLTADMKRMLLDALEIYERHDISTDIFKWSDHIPSHVLQDSIEAKMFGVRFTSWVKDQLRPVDPPTKFTAPKVTPTFTANQLIHHLMSSTKTNGPEFKKAVQKAERTKLQMVEMIVNEGNTRRFDIAVVQELAQNSLDAIREEKGGNRKELHFEVGEATVSGQLCGVLRVVDRVGMGWDNVLMAHVPFYSGKSTSAISTGEMGTGFFNVFRDTALVEMETVRDKKRVVWHSVPKRGAEGRVVDIGYDFQTSSTTRENGTTVTLYVPVSKDEGLTKFLYEMTTTIKEMLSGVNADLGHIKLKDGRFANTDKVLLNRAGMRTPSFVDGGTGFKMGRDERNFSRKYVQCSATDPGRLSIVYTNGVPFATITDFLRTLPGDLGRFSQILGVGWAMNLRKGAYQATQAREKIRELNPDVVVEIYLSLLDMTWMGGLFDGYAHLFGLGGEGGLFQNYTPPRDMYSEERWTPKDEYKGVPVGASDLLSDPYKIKEDYRPFGSAKTNSGQRSISQHLHNVVMALQSSKLVTGKLDMDMRKKEAWVNGKKDHVDLENFVTNSVGKCHFAKEIAKSIVKWVGGKHVDGHENSQDERERRRANRIPYPPDSVVHMAIEAMIRTYMKFGVAAEITLFREDMVTSVIAADTEESPHFSAKQIVIPVPANVTLGMPGFHQIVELIRWSKKQKASIVTRVELEENPAFYTLLCPGYGQRGSVIPHEMEHARTHTDHNAYGAHGEWHGKMHTSLNEEDIEFPDCVDIAYNRILETLVDGKTFCQTLTERLAAINLSPAAMAQLDDFIASVKEARAKSE